eukprot:TRINITY_DN3984_c0_g1_i5.p1 TRINITY_DN3984_c0_g1~~TRINITY_DN3984_c0_g1_i5.p1  ORF type:complete len:875 (-),score=162.05 TRINITY_DN3984_c0_g1_i5:35-2659(-)
MSVPLKHPENNRLYMPIHVSCGSGFTAVIACDFGNLQFTHQVGGQGTEEKKNYDLSDKSCLFILGKALRDETNRSMKSHLLGTSMEKKRELMKLNHDSLVIDNVKFKYVSCGSNFLVGISMDGFIYAWGDGRKGCLGNGKFSEVSEPERINMDGERALFVSCGLHHVGVVATTEKLYVWGDGACGQLGLDSRESRSIPTMVEKLAAKSISYVSCGHYHTAVVTKESLAMTFGSNKNGQLGLGDFDERLSPTQVEYLNSKVVARVTCGANQTFFLTNDGQMYACGNNRSNKLGFSNPDFINKNIKYPEPVNLPYYDMEGNRQEVKQEVVLVSTSSNFSLAINKQGDVYTWGINAFGVLGREKATDEEEEKLNLPAPIQGDYFKFNEHFKTAKDTSNVGDMMIEESDGPSTKIVNVQCGMYHTVALTDAGEVYVFGSNARGQHALTPEVKEEKVEAIKAKIKFETTLKEPSLVPTLISFQDGKQRRITSIATGREFIVAVENNRNLYSWGNNEHGQLGLNFCSRTETTPRLVDNIAGVFIKQVACGDEHMLILGHNGKVYSCGNYRYGRLGHGFLTSDIIQPKHIEKIQHVVMVAAGATHNFAIVCPEAFQAEKRGVKPYGEVRAWGHGWMGKLGSGDELNIYVPKKIDFPKDKYSREISISFVAAGREHSGALDHEGNLYLWGSRDRLYLKDEDDNEVQMNKNGPEEKKEVKLESSICTPIRHDERELKDRQFMSLHLGNYYNMACAADKKSLLKWGYFDDQLKTQDKKLSTPAFDRMQLDGEQIVALTNNHAAMVRSGKLYTWGFDNNIGRLGHSVSHLTENQKAAESSKRYNKEDKPKEWNPMELVPKHKAVEFVNYMSVSYTHLTLPTIYSV